MTIQPSIREKILQGSEEKGAEAALAGSAKKLTDQSSYQWKTTLRTEGGRPFGGNASTTGQIEKDGYTWISSTSPQTSFEFARKADKAAVVLDGNWMTMDQAAARSPVGGRGAPIGASANSRALHLAPNGASYTGAVEEFISGQPFPVTDFIINPRNGSMLLAVGGRGAQSALYRVTYVGNESTAPNPPDTRPTGSARLAPQT